MVGFSHATFLTLKGLNKFTNKTVPIDSDNIFKKKMSNFISVCELSGAYMFVFYDGNTQSCNVVDTPSKLSFHSEVIASKFDHILELRS